MIDFKKYSNPEIVSNIADVMSSPQRAPVRIVKWGLFLAVAGLIVDVLMLVYSNQPKYVTILSSVLIFFFASFSGVLLGAFTFFKDLNNSLQAILGYANKLIHLVIGDVCKTFDDVKSCVDEYRIILPSGNEIVRGVMLDVVNPAAKKCLESRVPIVGKIASKAYSLAIDALLKISSVFFVKVDKELDKIVNEQLSKAKGIANVPLNFVESAVEKAWVPMITACSDKYVGKAKGYIHRTFFFVYMPILAFAIAFFVASVALVYFAI